MKLELRRKRDLGRILDDAFAIYRARFGTLVLIAALVVVPVYLLVYGVGLGWLWSGYDASSVSATEIELADAAEQLAGLAAQLLVVTPLVTAMTVHIVRNAAEERRPTAREALAVGLDLFPKLLLTIALVALGVFGGFLLLIVPGIILAVRWVVVSQVVVVEGLSGSAAMRRSFDLTRDRFWASFLVLFVLLLLVSVLSAVVLAPLEYAAEEADAMALSLLGQILSSVLTLPLVAVAYTLLYFSLIADKEGAAPPAASPGPDVSGWREPEPTATAPQTAPGSLPGVGAGGDGLFGDGWAPPRPPG
jgi:hypothetical protein